MEDKPTLQANWRELELSQIGSILTGKTPSTKNSGNFGDGTPFITPSDIADQRYIVHTSRCITEQGLKEVKSLRVPPETIIVPCIGYIGKVSISGQESVTNQQINSIIPNPEFNSLYIYYSLKSIMEGIGYSISGGSVVPIINKTTFSKLTIRVPSRHHQDVIANILGSLDDKIELNRQINEKLEGIAQALFKSWFVDFDPVRAKAEGRDTGLPEHISSLFPASFIDSELGQIPEGWRVSRIEELCDFIENGSTPKRMVDQYWNGRINWFKTGELKDSPLICSEEKITLEGLKNSSCRIWPAGTILVALYASPTVGRLGILTLEGTSNQACSALKAKQCVGNQYLFYTLLFNRESLQRIAVGAAQQNISQGVLRAHKVLAPSVELSGLFQERMEPALLFKTSLLKENAVLANLRDTLLPKLISGELPIPDAERIVGRYL